MIKFSIITVCLNAGEDLKYTIDNLLQQDYENYEVIVKDGFSTDGSTSCVPQNEKVRFIQKKDKSVYDAMNQAIDAATGDFCLFINAGDGLYEKSTLTQIAGFIEANEADFYYGKSYTVISGVTNYAPEKITKYYCYRTTMCHQAMVIRTLYLKERGYTLDIKISADREWLVYAFVQAKMRFMRMPMYVSLYKGGGISYGNQIVKAIRAETKEINRRHFSASERIIFGIRRSLTLPSLRSYISGNPRFKSTYYMLRYLWLNRGGSKNG